MNTVDRRALCDIPPEMGERIRKKRKSMGLSMEALGRGLGLSSSTIHCWETGKVTHTTAENLQDATDFLAGVFDDKLLGKNNIKLDVKPEMDFPAEAHTMADEIISAFHILAKHPKLKREFLEQLNRLA